MLEIRRATQQDAEAIIDVQNCSFLADFHRYGVCPGYQPDKAVVMESIEHLPVYLILWNGKPAGDAVVIPGENATAELGCLCVVPEFQGIGIGRKTIAFLENTLPHITCWHLKTPTDKEENHHFYRSCGYRMTGEEDDMGILVSRFEKHIPPHQ